MKSKISKSLEILTVGGAFIAISQSQTLIDPHYKLQDNFYFYILSFGIILTIISFLIMISELFKFILINFGESKYSCELIKYGEIAGFLKFLEEIFSNANELPSLERVQSWHQKNNQIIYYTLKTKKVFKWLIKSRIGCFAILPVNEIAVSRLNQNDLLGKEITADYIVPPQIDPAGFYVGVIAAKNNKLNTFTILTFLGNIKGKFERYNVPIFARPISPIGYKMIKTYNFEPCKKSSAIDNDVIYKYEGK